MVSTVHTALAAWLSQQVLQPLERPFPLALSARAIAARALAAGGFVWCFLWAFGPFGLSGLAPLPRLGVTAGYGAVTAAVLLLSGGLLRLWPALELRWTLGRHLLLSLAHVLLIAVGNWAYTVALGFAPGSAAALLMLLGWTLLVGLFPIVGFTYAAQARLERRYGAEAAGLKPAPPATDTNTYIDTTAGAASAPGAITLRGTLAGEQLQLAPEALLALVAADNYVEVHHLRQGAPARTLLRQSLAALEAQLAPWPQFMRVHRSYVANLALVTAATGNAQGYRLELRGLAQPVPVARAYTAAVRRHLQGAG